VQHLLNRNVHF